MNNFILSLKEAKRILKRHRLLSFILIVQTFFCIYMIGTIANQVFFSNDKIENFKRNITDKTYYKLTENLDDTLLYRYMHDENLYYKEISHFCSALLKEPSFRYISASRQGISVWDINIPETCLEGYEHGYSNYAINKDENGRNMSSVKSYQVSRNFFNEFNINLSKGELFSEQDYSRTSNNIPVILGNEYINNFSLGDVFEGNYLDENFSCKVIGFLEPNSGFSTGQSIEYCDRYIILPQFNPEPSTPTDFNKKRLLQQVGGVIISDRPFSDIEKRAEELLKETNAPTGRDGIFLVDPSGMANKSVLKEYSNMSSGVSKQFNILLVVLTLFVIASVSVTVNGFIREHHYEYGVFMLTGAKLKHIALSVFFLICSLIFTADIAGILMFTLFGRNIESILFSQAIVFFIVLISSIIPLLHVKRIDISDLIGGKE